MSAHYSLPPVGERCVQRQLHFPRAWWSFCP